MELASHSCAQALLPFSIASKLPLTDLRSPHHFEPGRAFEVARRDVSVVRRPSVADAELDRGDLMSDEHERLRHQAGADEPRGALRHRARRCRRARRQLQPEQSPRQSPRMGSVIFRPDSAYDPIREAAPVGVLQARGTQYAHPLSLKRRERHCSDAIRHVRFDNAAGIGPVFERTDVHRDVRPGRSGQASHDRGHMGLATRKQNIPMLKHCAERLRIHGPRSTALLGRLREIERERIDQAGEGPGEER